MKNLFLKILVLVFTSANAVSQNTITGTFPGLGNQWVKLSGFEGFGNYPIDSVLADERGNFVLSFHEKDYGMGYLSARDNKPFIVILAEGENLKLKGETLALPQTIVTVSGKENLLFAQYASEFPRREQALSAWDYLEKIYSMDSLFARHEEAVTAIANEKNRIRKEERSFLARLDPKSYAGWFLPVRKLVSSVPTIAQYRTGEIPATLAAFRNMDYTDTRLYKSGLLNEIIESHFWLIENSGRSLDSVFIEMNVSIDSMIDNLLSDGKKFNEITGYLFKLLERRSLFGSSEYLALKVLNQVSCTIDNDLASQMESYRAMKKGSIASDFEFQGDRLTPGYTADQSPKKLSDLRSKYTVVLFGASWCPMCTRELSNIAALYDKWKKQGVELVFVSLDEDKKAFQEFAGGFPFISICDYRKWESPVVKSYHVFATPTLYLLNDKREILLRPNSVQQMDAWVDWFLVQGNR